MAFWTLADGQVALHAGPEHGAHAVLVRCANVFGSAMLVEPSAQGEMPTRTAPKQGRRAERVWPTDVSIRALLEQPLADMQVAVVASFEHGSLAVSIGP